MAALSSDTSQSLESLVATATGATEESCRTALLLADGDINHAAELILSGVVPTEQPAAPYETQPAAGLGRARKNTAKHDRQRSLQPLRMPLPPDHDRQRSLQPWQMPLPPDASYTSLVNRSMQPRCGVRSNVMAGRLLLAMLMHPRLGEHSAAASAMAELEDALSSAGEQLSRLHPPTELFEELARRRLTLQPRNDLTICWRRDDQGRRLSRLITTCDVNGTDAAGFSPLYRAASTGDAVAVEAIVRGRANLNGAAMANRWKFTPLMEAARNGDVQMVELLLQLGASKKAVDHRGRTAQQIARLGDASGHNLQHLEDLLSP